MSQMYVTLVAIILFVITPIFFLFLNILDFWKNKKQGKEYDRIYYGMQEYLQLLKTADLGKFDGEFSNWLAKTINSINALKIKTSLRLLIQTKYIGLGEGHRERIYSEIKYKNQLLKKTHDLSNSYRNGNDIEIFQKTAELLNFFILKTTPKIEVTLEDKEELRNVTSTALENAAIKIEEGDIFSYLEISKAMKEVSNSQKVQSNSLDLLILQWALIKIKEKRNPYTDRFVFSKRNRLTKKLRRIAKMNRQEKIGGIVNVLCSKE